MCFAYLNNTELEKAIETYTAYIKSLGRGAGAEEIPVQQAMGRVTSEAVYAKISSPHYNASAMDGIAVRARQTFGATETTPVLLEELRDFIRVDTGDPLPKGFDAVVMIEEVIEAGDRSVKLVSAVTPWQHVRQIGEDICASEMIIPSNTRIEPSAIGAMLAGGVLKVYVWRRPVTGIIPTGDEIVSPTANPGEGEIIEFNSSIFSAMLTEWGAVPKVYGIVPDRLELIKAALIKAAEECDIVIINAGSSAGREDYSSRAIAEVGEVTTHGLAIRPGKPTIMGVINGRPVIGVPGYPVSGIIVMEKLVKQVVGYVSSTGFTSRDKVKAVLSRKVVSSLKYKEFVRMKLGRVNDRLVATPLNRGAGVVTSFVKADGIVEIPLNSEGYEAGQEVEVELLKSQEEISNTLVLIGSHDPLIDAAIDIIRKKCPEEYVSSAHVGSLGGIMAVKRGEAHIAGTHLLDEATGEYNTSYVKKYLANQDIRLIKCVKRQQGLMVAPGNPKSIRGIEDVGAEGVSYVNRQKGSGTRILLDYMLKNKGISPSQIYGYDREEFTHMSVAALIASGSADAGMGIYSAAKAYGLDFIPVCEEDYDFIVPESFMRLKGMKHFLEVLESEEFKKALEGLGGYRF